MKKLTALLLATSLSMTLFGCNNKNTGTQYDKDDELVTVWLVTSETEYNADGSKGFHQRTYTYTDKGMLLSTSHDTGTSESVWDEDQGVYMYVFHPFDGNVEETIKYHYSSHGDFVYKEEIRKTFDADGNEINGSVVTYGERDTYHYNEDGMPETLDLYPTSPNSTDPAHSYLHYCYDDNDRLVEIFCEYAANGDTTWQSDYRYDQQGRFVGLTKRYREYTAYYQYEYNSAGQLTRITESRGNYQTPIDDQHFSQSAGAMGEFWLNKEIQCTYDEDGNLLTRGDDVCTYRDGKLHTVTYGDGVKIVYVDDESDMVSTPETIHFLRDDHGNVTKIVYYSGAYSEITYQEFRLTRKAAIQCTNMMIATNTVDVFGEANSYVRSDTPARCIPEIPVTDLYTTDCLKRNYGV